MYLGGGVYRLRTVFLGASVELLRATPTLGPEGCPNRHSRAMLAVAPPCSELPGGSV